MAGETPLAEEPEGGPELQPPTSGLRWRLIFAVLGGIGMAIIYGLKVNLSVAIVAMVNHTAVAAIPSEHHVEGINVTSVSDHNGEEKVLDALSCYDPHAKDNTSGDSVSDGIRDGPFAWSERVEGFILGSYFYGYLVTQIPGGRLSEVASAKWVFFVAVIMNIVCTLLSPVCSYAGYEWLMVMRIIEGLGGGVTFPAMNVLISKWAPSKERSMISTIVYGGTALGTVISIPTAGLLAGSLGWEGVFYVHGGLACIWCFLWVALVTDTPQAHPFISDAEKEYITVATGIGKGPKKKSPPIPWVAIWTSIPFWAVIIAHTLNNFGWYMLLVELPAFMGKGLGFKIEQNAALSAVPFLCNWLFSLFYSNRLDWARSKGYLSTTWARKLSMAIASIVPGICLIVVCLVGCDSTAVVIMMIIGTLFFGTMFSGVFSNHVDLASNYAGVLMGITNMAATIPGFVVPWFVGELTHGKTGLAPWHTVFYTTSGLLFLEFVIYTLMASGEEQPWNHVNAPPPAYKEEEDEANQQELLEKNNKE